MRALINGEIGERNLEKEKRSICCAECVLISRLWLSGARRHVNGSSLTLRLKSPGGNWTLLTVDMVIKPNLSVEWAWLVVHQDD